MIRRFRSLDARSAVRVLPLVGMLTLAAAAATQAQGTPAGPVRSAGTAMSPTSTNLAGLDPAMGLVRDPAISAMLPEISPARLRRIDSMLVSFGTRQTNSDTLSSTRGIGAARRWIHGELSQYARDCNGCLRIEYNQRMAEGNRIPTPVNVVSVLAWLPGRDTMRVIVVGGHYDSCLCSVPGGGMTNAIDDAPGADDDGSGTSAVIELARVFSRRYPRGLDATIVFAAFAGEEQGTIGSLHLAERLHAENKTVVGAITNDIIGNVVADDGRTDSTTVRVFSPDPDNGASRELARYAWASSVAYMAASQFKVLPVFRLDRIGRGGDHRPFVELGDPGIRFTELLENYKRQHLATDVLEHVNFGYVANVARVNAALVASLAQAPVQPSLGQRGVQRDQASGGSKFRVTWARVPAAASYEVLVRRTFAPTWEVVIPVTDTTMLLDYQVDDMYVGLRAVGSNGHRSMPAVYPSPPRTQPAAAAGRQGGGRPRGGRVPPEAPGAGAAEAPAAVHHLRRPLLRRTRGSVPSGFSHLVADFIGVPGPQLRDATLLRGLLIAAAGAAGFSAMQAPVVRQLPSDGLACLLLLDGCHISVHTFPDRQLMLLDVLALATHDPRKALDVFARRVEATEIRSETRDRG